VAEPTLRLEIVTPDGVVFSGDVEMVTLTGVEGELGILPQHVRMMTRMLPGELVARRRDGDALLAVGGGLVEVRGDGVSVLTDMAVPADQIDAAEAEQARLRAEARLRDQLSVEEVAAAAGAMARAVAQLRVTRRRRA
jgi:F-type H+-transporting ATPase subunit epsilon